MIDCSCSLYDSLLELLIYDRQTLDELCDDLKLQPLTETEIMYLREYRDALKPVAKALDDLQVK